MKVLHILDHSLPYITGYSLRCHYIIRSQREIGINPLAITSPLHEIVSHPMELIEGISHYRTFFPEDTVSAWRQCPFKKGQSLISIMSQAISLIASNQKIDLIHAHSPFTNGLAALETCRRQKIPLLYEMRDLDESSSAGLGVWKSRPLSPALRQDLESFLCRQAGAIVVMGKRQREQIIKQGIPEENVYIIPSEEIIRRLKPVQQNGGFTNFSDPTDLPDLMREHNLQNDPVARFICSLYHQEGVIPLLRIFLKVRDGVCAARFLSINNGHEESGEEGSGEESGSGEDGERMKPHHHDASGHIIYVGQGRPRNKGRFHSLINVLVYPCLKIDGKSPHSDPIEALTIDEDSMPGGVTDLYELATEKQAGSWSRESDISDLTGKYLKSIMSKQMQQNHEERARQRAGRNQARLSILTQYLQIYKKLLTS